MFTIDRLHTSRRPTAFYISILSIAYSLRDLPCVEILTAPMTLVVSCYGRFIG